MPQPSPVYWPADQTPIVPNGTITVEEMNQIPDIANLNISTNSMSPNNNVNGPQIELITPPLYQNACQPGYVNDANDLAPPPPSPVCMNPPVAVSPVGISPAGDDDSYQVPVTAYRLIDNVISVLRDVQCSLSSLKGSKRFMSVVSEVNARLASLIEVALAITASSTTPIEVRKLARFQIITERDEYSYMLALNTQLNHMHKYNWDYFIGLPINFCNIANDFFTFLQANLPILSLHKYCDQLVNSLPLSVSHDSSLKGVVYSYVLCSAMENEMKRCYIKYYYPSLMEDGVNFCRISRLKNLFWEDLNKRLTHMGAQSFFEDTKCIHVSLSKEVYFFYFNDETSFTTQFGSIMDAFYNMVRASCPCTYYPTLDTSRHCVDEIWKAAMSSGFVSQRTVYSLIISIATFHAHAYEGYKEKDKNKIMESITKCVPLLENLKVIEKNYGIKSDSYSELVKCQLQSMANASLYFCLFNNHFVFLQDSYVMDEFDGINTLLLGDMKDPDSGYSMIINKLILRHKDVEIRHVQAAKNGVKKDFLVRNINKSVRKQMFQRVSSISSSTMLNGLQKLCDEIEIREELNHPNIVSLFAVRESEFSILLFEEWSDFHSCMTIKIDHGQLICSIPNKEEACYTEKEAASIFWDICQAVNYLHNRQICHLNIWPEHFLINADFETKLSGFINVCNIKNDLIGGLRETFPGVSLFQAPECFKDGFFSSYSADLWSLGVSLYFLVFGRSHITLTPGIEIHEIVKDYSELPPMEGVSLELQDLLSLMLSPDVGKRPCLQAIMSSSWFKKFGYVFNEEKDSNDPINSTSQDWTSFNWTSSDYMHDKEVFDVISFWISENVSSRKREGLASSRINSSTRLLNSNSSLVSRRSSTISLSVTVDTGLPHKGRVKWMESCCCGSCWRKCELYVEKGKAKVYIKRRCIITLSLQDAFLVKHSEPCLFEIRMNEGDSFLFKARNSCDKSTWEVSIANAILLVKFNVCLTNCVKIASNTQYTVFGTVFFLYY